MIHDSTTWLSSLHHPPNLLGGQFGDLAGAHRLLAMLLVVAVLFRPAADRARKKQAEIQAKIAAQAASSRAGLPRRNRGGNIGLTDSGGGDGQISKVV